MGPVTIAGDGGFLVATLGMHGALAAYHDPTGIKQTAFGTPLDSVVPALNPRQAKEDLIAGRVPPLFRNNVLPVFAPSGERWLILNGEGRLERYASNGTRQVSVSLQEPEMKQVWNEVVTDAKATLDDRQSIQTLLYVLDANVVDRTLWLLLNTRKEGSSVLVAVDETGRVEHRIRFTNVRGAASFAFDRTRRKVFFALPATANVVGASLPDRIAGIVH
jgi:hypothetical protein